jgi:FlaA1/EpsC-like NDP-sugar epimerase
MLSVLDRLPRSAKRAVMVIFDLVAIMVAVWAAFAIRLGSPFPAELVDVWWLLLVMPPVTVIIFTSFKLYRSVIRYLGPQFAFALFWGLSASAMFMTGLAFMSQTAGWPRSTPIIYWLVCALFIGGSRMAVRGYFRTRSHGGKKSVIVYGAGQAGARLVSALVHGQEFHPVALVDDDADLWGNDIRGVRIHSPEKLAELVESHQVTDILMAVPSARRTRRLEIVETLRSLPVKVSTIPGLLELVSGSAKFDEVRPIRIEDLLGREPVEPDQSLFRACISGKSVLVTGAGGSIGSELCRQIVRLQPKRLVLVEQAEFNLYDIEQSLRQIMEVADIEIEIVPFLGNVLDGNRMQEIVRLYRVQTIYHAAAYKHVPIVEYNLVEGIRNNTLGTWTMARVAMEERVENFVLISTDKAVRPTNAMGATKRMAELVLQGMAQLETQTRFCMVRFGNVLDSSGSVVPLFREQIKSGGPVTVTHPEIIRYFMTIPEAAQLVIQAGSLGSGGDVFVLDMGEPVKIVDLARTMIRLAGFEERTKEHPEGDIAIEFTGLRPGEKLYEDLLIGTNTTGTPHRQILRASEDDIVWSELEVILEQLIDATREMNCDRIRTLLREHVNGYKPAGDLVDLAWLKQQEVDSQDALPFPAPVIETKPLTNASESSAEDAETAS